MDYYALGKRIRECRINHNYTQLQVANMLLFSQKHIGNIERGDARPSVDLLVRFSNTLNVSMDYLLQDSLQFQTFGNSSRLSETVEQFLEKQQSEITRLQEAIKFISYNNYN